MRLFHRIIVASVLIIGCIATYFSYSFSENMSEIDAQKKFSDAATLRVSKIKEKLRDTQGVLLAFKAFFDSSDNVTDDDFSNFAAVLTNYRPQLSVIAWLEKSPSTDSKQDKNTDYQYSIRYLYPYHESNFTSSLIASENLSSISVLNGDSNLISMSVLDFKYENKLLIFSLPIFSKGEMNQGDDKPLGFLVMAVDPTYLVIDSVKMLPVEPVVLSIENNDQILTIVNANGISLYAEKVREYLPRPHNLNASEPMSIGGDRLDINVSSNLELFYSYTYLSSLTLVLGTLISLFLTYITYISIRHHHHIIDLVKKKTNDLKNAQVVILKQEKQLEFNVKKKRRIAEIQQALSHNELCLYYQPKVNMRTGVVFGAEALIRWIHPEKGVIPPLEFLPLLDGTDLECQIGEWVINQALLQLERWQLLGIQLEISVNISSHHLQTDSFFIQLRNALSQYPAVDAKYLQLEILESTAFGDLNTIIKIIKKCQDTFGVRVALDDFGTGYSSLTHLRNLPIDIIKIDKSFTRDMLDDPSDYAIIDGVIGLADAFNREVVAEGVETTAHGLMLLINNCEQAQGYGIAKPMPAEKFPDWLTDYTPNKYWLRCGHERRTEKESKVKSFKLIIAQWRKKFITSIKLPPEEVKYWPIMDPGCCLCHDWLKRAERSQIFEQQWLLYLDKAHEEFHLYANDLLAKYHYDEIGMDDFAKLQLLFDDINNFLELDLAKTFTYD